MTDLIYYKRYIRFLMSLRTIGKKDNPTGGKMPNQRRITFEEVKKMTADEWKKLTEEEKWEAICVCRSIVNLTRR